VSEEAGDPSFGAPVVAVDPHTGSDEVPTVDADNRRGAQLATQHLLDLGHRDIGHLTGAGGIAALRRASYEATMADAGLVPVVTGSGATTEEDGYVATRELLDTRPEVTAIFAANDVMLLGALAALRERRLAVPDDVSVVGYDNSPLAASHYLALTTVDDRSVDVGSHAARAILARRRGERVRPFRYLDKGNVATIGRARAVADLHWVKASGFPAWVLWLVIHIWYLIGFQNRILVLIRWSFSFFTRGRGGRVIEDFEGEGSPLAIGSQARDG
jgi:hypothetical protein